MTIYARGLDRRSVIHEVYDATPAPPGTRLVDGITSCGTPTVGWLRLSDDAAQSTNRCRLCWPSERRFVMAPPAPRGTRTSRA